MFLTITKDAQAKILAQRKANQVMILDYDDGVGAYSKVGGCSMTNGYRLLFVAKDTLDDAYQAKMDSDMGAVHFKDYSQMYMDNKMTLAINPKNASLKLSGANSGEMCGLVPIVDVDAAK